MSLGGTATEEDGELIGKLFGSVGKIWRADEKLFDAITGLRYVASVSRELYYAQKILSCNYYPEALFQLITNLFSF